MVLLLSEFEALGISSAGEPLVIGLVDVVEKIVVCVAAKIQGPSEATVGLSHTVMPEKFVAPVGGGLFDAAVAPASMGMIEPLVALKCMA